MGLTLAFMSLVAVAPLATDVDQARVAEKWIERLGGQVERDENGAIVTARLWCREAAADDLKHLSALTNLRQLDLYSTKIKECDKALRYLAPLKRLSYLTLHGTGITDEGLKQLAPLNALVFLDVSESHVSDAGLKHLASLKRLAAIDLSFTQVSDKGLSELKDHRESE